MFESVRRLLGMWTYPVEPGQYVRAGAPIAGRTQRDADVSIVAATTRPALSNTAGRCVVAEPGETVLQASERAGWDPPFGCRKGRCRRCVVPLTRGRVIDSRHGLASGTGASIQTCVSIPISDVEVQL